MSDFKKIASRTPVDASKLAVDSATVLEHGDLVALTSGEATKAAVGSTAVAFLVNGSANGDTDKLTAYGEGTIIEGTANRNFAAADRGQPASVILSGSDIQINLDNVGGSAGVFEVLPDESAGTVGSPNKVRVRIVKGL